MKRPSALHADVEGRDAYGLWVFLLFLSGVLLRISFLQTAIPDMELRRLNISYQLELLKQKAEEGARAAEAKEREDKRADELAKLQAYLQHEEKLEGQVTNRTDIKADVEKVRAI